MARPPRVVARGRWRNIERETIDWAALRAEYVAGGIGQKALAKKHGVSSGAVQKRAREEGWVALRGAAAEQAAEAAAKVEEEAAAKAEELAAEQAEEAAAEKAGAPGDGQIALRLRRALLLKLERAAATIPCDATEMKTTADDGAVKLLKLRDLTAAYKELVGDLDTQEREQSRVVIDL